MEQKKQDNPFEEGAKTPQEETIALTVDGQELTLTMEQLVQAAISGLSRRGEIIRMAGAAGQVPDGLVSAYRKYEIAQLKAKLAALEQNAVNREQAVGSAHGDGQPGQLDPVIAALRGEQ